MCIRDRRKAAPKAGVRKQKQPNEVSKFGTLPGSTHCQLDFPVADRSLDHSTLHSAQVTRSIAAVKASIDPDVLGKNKKQWNAGVLPGNRPAGVYRFPDPALKRRNSAFQSIPQYETNYRSDYIAKFNGPVKPNDSRRGYNITDLRDETRMLTDDLEWTNDKGQRMSGTVKPTARKQGEQPWSKKPYDKPAWNVSVEQDFTERHAVDAAVLSKAVKNSETKKEQISATRMGLIARHNSVAQRIREEKTAARAEAPLPRPPTPTKAAMARTERQTKTYQHSGVWEFNEREQRHMWSDTGSFDPMGNGDTVKVVTEGRWSFAAPV
eukprot:TRINITY_DN3376_c0_g1_i1.p1 TRINITY_DN3376_c0_g1~~TRINITY_DN3376_c0_g1_i1.p1  ORF type:complete len:323 (+),score=68.80 TRINITY_DN3376_c0_g1_i1:136-1104(+)